MAKQKLEGLISQLHDRFAASETSPEQERLMAQMKSQLDEWEGAKPGDGDLREVAELLLEDAEEEHPKAAMVLREIIDTLAAAGF